MMKGLSLCFTFCLLLFPADAERRAFVVGVQNYDELANLSKTIADAEGFAEVFGEDLGFAVTKLIDPTFSDFLIALSNFEASIQEGDEVVFVFSGHGWSDGARNFLAMRDAPLHSTEVVLERLTFDLNEYVIDSFRARDPEVVIAIVDACRDNPFDLGTKNITKGLVPQQTIPGTLVVYAAGANQKALDRLEPGDPSPYSVFTRALLPKLKDRQKPLMRAFDEARSETSDLANTISHLQRPAIYSDVSLDFCFSDNCKFDQLAEEPRGKDFATVRFEVKPKGLGMEITAYCETSGGLSNSTRMILSLNGQTVRDLVYDLDRAFENIVVREPGAHSASVLCRSARADTSEAWIDARPIVLHPVP